MKSQKKIMNNTGKENTNTNKLLLQHNEEETTTLNINEISDFNIINAQINEPKNNECNNDNEDKESVIHSVLNIELEDVTNKVNELEQKCTVFQLVDTDRKSPSLWVQYNQTYPKVYAKPHQQYQGDYGGAPLQYDPGSRNYFVKFVFIILLVMLSITAAFTILVLVTPALKDFYIGAGLFLMIGSAVVLFAMNYVMACSACARVPPCNFISLVIVVVAMSNLVASITVRYKTNILLLALMATIITVALCVLLACSSFDFTTWYIYVIVIAMVFMAISMIASITMLAMGMRFKPLQLVLLFVGALIQVIMLIMELQMILGGRAIEIGENDYALAAYLLYTSIIDIFLKIVQIMGLMDS